jgi:hypothetical protein
VCFDLGGVEYRSQVSRFADGRLAEIFLDGGKVGSSAQIAAHDAAVAASLALQHGCEVKTLRHALLKLANGKGAGPVGVLLDEIEELGGK